MNKTIIGMIAIVTVLSIGVVGVMTSGAFAASESQASGSTSGNAFATSQASNTFTTGASVGTQDNSGSCFSNSGGSQCNH